MTGLSSTARCRRGRFSCPTSGNAKEDRGSGGGDGDDGTTDNCGSREERDNGSALSATAVNPLNSAKRVYRRRREGGVTDDNGNNSGVVKERRRRGGEAADASRRSEHSAARCRLSISLHREWIAHTMPKNRVVILAG